MNAHDHPLTPRPVLYLPHTWLVETHAAFFAAWEAQVEAVCFWCGLERDTAQVVTTIAIPQARQAAGAYRIRPESLRRIADRLKPQGLVILAQVHTHPPRAGIQHSPYDDAHAYSTRMGSLSLVWPDYARMLAFSLDFLGVHERRDEGWVRLTSAEVAQRIRVVDARIDDRIWQGGWTGLDDE